VPKKFFLGGKRREYLKVCDLNGQRTKRVHVTNARDNAAFANTPKGIVTPREGARSIVISIRVPGMHLKL
jgi:hypothetical protein